MLNLWLPGFNCLLVQVPVVVDVIPDCVVVSGGVVIVEVSLS